MKPATILLLALATFSAAPAERTFTGTISDDMCAIAGHARMQMGPTDAECTRACVALHGAAYVLVSGKNVYVLGGQTTADQLAGQRVKVVGMLDAKTKTIRVRSLTASPRR
jgi:type 1 fimbria pilin